MLQGCHAPPELQKLYFDSLSGNTGLHFNVNRSKRHQTVANGKGLDACQKPTLTQSFPKGVVLTPGKEKIVKKVSISLKEQKMEIKIDYIISKCLCILT